MAKLFKVSMYLVDPNDFWKEASLLKNYFENRTSHGFVEHVHIEESDLGEWRDDHPLNYIDCPEAVYETYLKEDGQ